MKILLINENATVEKLVRLSAQRIGLELLAATIATDAVAGEYTWVLVDNDSLGGASITDLRAKYPNAKIGLLYPKNGARAEGYDLYIEKPFLPTELIDEFSARGKQEEALDDDLPSELPSVDDEALPSFDGEADDFAASADLDLGVFENTPPSKISELQSSAPAEPAAPKESGFDETANLDPLEDISSLDALGTIDEIDQNAQTPADSLNADETLEFDLADLDFPEAAQSAAANEAIAPKAQETGEKAPPETLNNAESVAPAAKTTVLDKEEIKEVKELLNEINEPAQPAAPAGEIAAQTERFSLGEEFDDAKPAAAEEDLKLELGENGALLDDEDLADLRDAEDSAAKDDLGAGKDDLLPEIEELKLDLDETPSGADDDKKPKLVFGDIPPKPAEEEAEPAAEEFNLDFDDAKPDGSQTQPQEQTEAFNISFDETPSEPIAAAPSDAEEEFATLAESDIALALGEEAPIADESAPSLEESGADKDTQGDLDEAAATISFGELPIEGGEAVKASDSGKALENILAALPPNSLRELLDGMQLTINISFPKKK